MPCWTRTQIKVLKKQIKDMNAMKKALDNLSIQYQENLNELKLSNGMSIRSDGISYRPFQQDEVNNIMTQYSKVVVLDWANQHGFFVEQKQNEMEFNLIQY